MKIVFDLDGTLFSSGELAILAYRKVFSMLELKPLDDCTYLNTLGYPIKEIWEMLLPDCNQNVRDEAGQMMEEVENGMIKNGIGNLYPDVIMVLEELKERGHSLYILSNCDKPYLDVIGYRFGFDEIFNEQYCASMFPNQTKDEILKYILAGDTHGVMVGDRFHDIKAGKTNRINTVWCNYGFSNEELDPDYEINKFSELLEIIVKIEEESK
jgi:phosphoglycolate phosphatase-like HAD superfamily hydrolase